jgi:DNA polymerase III subunit gamma/tau
MSFYNKYRPSTLAEIDNSQVRKTILSLLTKPKEDLPHAYLFIGPRGTGKTTTARIVAKLFNCTNPSKSGEPCGECDICKAITNGSSIDIMEIDAASNTGVDNIRDLKDKIQLVPVQAKWKIYIIDEVHMLSTGAFNALLKTLEEPPPHTVFILATTDPHKVPATIQSRCLVLNFVKPALTEIVIALQRIAKGEQIQIDEDAYPLIAEAADGSFRDATKLFEQATLLDKHITKKTIEEMLKTTDVQLITTFISHLLRSDAVSLINQIELMLKDGADIKSFYVQILRELQKKLVQSVLSDNPDKRKLQQVTDVLHRYYADLRSTNFPELSLQIAVLTACEQPSTTQQTTSTVKTKIESVVTPSHPVKPPSVIKPPTTISSDVHPTTPTPPVSPQVDITTTLSVAGPFTTEQLTQHWSHVIDEVKKIHHATSGVLRSAKPNRVENGIVIIETSYAFHRDKLNESVAKDAITKAIKTLFGEKVNLEIMLGKK